MRPAPAVLAVFALLVSFERVTLGQHPQNPAQDPAFDPRAPLSTNGTRRQPHRPPDVVSMDDASVDRFEAWLDALTTHEAGVPDEALERIASWSDADLRTLWINTTAMMKLMREPAWKKIFTTIDGVRQASKPMSFTIEVAGQPRHKVQYSLKQTLRMKVMACAADGDLFCPEILATGALSPALDRLSDAARRSRRGGDDNFVLRRGAMLHTDAAIAGQAFVGPHAYDGPRSQVPGAPMAVKVELFDGGAAGSIEIGIHWTLARMLLDDVIPAGSKRPAPARDPQVREWYRATGSWMQRIEDHDTTHLDRARQLFPDDPDILFLSGCQRETFASPRIQGGIADVKLPKGLAIDIASDRDELRRAEEYFRRAIAARPGMTEAHLHLGHVLLLRGSDADASAHLQQARDSLADPELEYYRALMLGTAEEHLGRLDAARASYDSAARLEPSAQAPLVALSELERRRGNRAAALQALQRAFAMPSSDYDRDDPWWRYYTSQARDADEQIDRMRAHAGTAGPEPNGRPR
ncbi:MAG TPA: tetratricopeptide repeat protein [Bryobacteraceae bacterium]|nr:tetratricopeptide repeat protein [Bryobacteraceae bacterium]